MTIFLCKSNAMYALGTSNIADDLFITRIEDEDMR